MSLRSRRALAGLGLLSLTSLPAPAQDVARATPAPSSPMRFYWAHNGGNCRNCSFVAAVGRITAETAGEFRRFMATAPGQVRGTTVYLHSPGGSLLGGIELGRQFRTMGVNTTVGHPVRTRDPNGEPFLFAAGAECMSACVFAFAGGERRAYEPDGGYGAVWAMHSWTRQTLGVHQFYRAPGAGGSAASGSAPRRDAETYDRGLADAQQISGRLVDYLAAMGVQARLLDLAARAGPDTVRPLSRAEAFGVGLANDPAPPPPWLITPSAGGLVLRTTVQLEENSMAAEIACDRAMPAGLSVRLAVNADMRYLANGGRDINAVLRENFGGAKWLSAPIGPRTVEWRTQARQFRWDGSRLIIEVTLPQPAASHLATGGAIVLSPDLPGFIGRGLPQMTISAPEIAEAQPLLLRNCPQR